MTKRVSGFFALSLVGALVVSCTSGEASPSQGQYTIQFPSTAAAVATDFVQLFIYDFAPDQRTAACADLISARKRKDNSVTPLVTGPQVNVCELLGGAKPITVPYGEKAVLAVALRGQDDFMIGCVIQTFGDGNALLTIPVELIDLTHPVPTTACNSVSDRCNQICKAS